MNVKDFDSALVDARVLACEKSMQYATISMQDGDIDDDNADSYNQWMGFVVYLFLGTLTSSNDKRCTRQIKFAAHAYYYYFLTHVAQYELTFEKAFDLQNMPKLMALAKEIVGDRSEFVLREDLADYKDVCAYIDKRSIEL